MTRMSTRRTATPTSRTASPQPSSRTTCRPSRSWCRRSRAHGGCRPCAGVHYRPVAHPCTRPQLHTLRTYDSRPSLSSSTVTQYAMCGMCLQRPLTVCCNAGLSLQVPVPDHQLRHHWWCVHGGGHPGRTAVHQLQGSQEDEPGQAGVTRAPAPAMLKRSQWHLAGGRRRYLRCCASELVGVVLRLTGSELVQQGCTARCVMP